MKNILKHSKNNDIQISESENINQLSNSVKKQNRKEPLKIIKGKVKVYNNDRVKIIDHEYSDDETELNLVSERMLLFLKFTFISLILFTLILFIKKNF